VGCLPDGVSFWGERGESAADVGCLPDDGRFEVLDGCALTAEVAEVVAGVGAGVTEPVVDEVERSAEQTRVRIGIGERAAQEGVDVVTQPGREVALDVAPLWIWQRWISARSAGELHGSAWRAEEADDPREVRSACRRTPSVLYRGGPQRGRAPTAKAARTGRRHDLLRGTGAGRGQASEQQDDDQRERRRSYDELRHLRRPPRGRRHRADVPGFTPTARPPSLPLLLVGHRRPPHRMSVQRGDLSAAWPVDRCYGPRRARESAAAG